MCGITGIWNLDGKPVSEKEISDFNDSLSHRGPDGSGIYRNRSCNLGIGHRRLSILDPSEKGRQPMSYKNGRYWITYNGEIYNFLELRSELAALGHSFASDCDTEVILAAYDQWGEDCLHRFNGMWAFAILDERDGRLFLARDRFGIKPLYYTFIPGQLFAFASETLAFKHLERYQREMDPEMVAAELKHPFNTEGRGFTIFKSIYQILPGHFIVMGKNDGAIRQKRWWSTAASILKDIPDSYEERISDFRRLFFEACALRMRSDVPLGTALSGGLDSSAVYCTIRSIMNQTPKLARVPDDWSKAFIGTFPGTELDERKYADEVIAHTSGQAKYILPDETNLPERVLMSTILFDTIYSSPLLASSNIYESMKKSGVKVSLDGHGSDEMLFGYQTMIDRAYIHHRDGGYGRGALRKIFGELYHKPEGAYLTDRDLRFRFTDFLRPFVPSLLRKRIVKREEAPTMGEPDTASVNLKGPEKIAYSAFHTVTLPTILRNFDRASMRHGVEIRMPFMDWRLVQYAFSLPFTDKIYGGVNKRILRDSMRGIIPEKIRTRKLKIGLNAPMIEWFNGPLKELIMDIVSSRSFLESSFWDGRGLRNLAERNMLKGEWTWNACSRFWPYISAELIIRNNGKKQEKRQ